MNECSNSYPRADISQVWENGGGNYSTICLLHQHIYVYISQQLLQKLEQLYDTSHMFILYFPFLLGAHYWAHLGSQPRPFSVMHSTTLYKSLALSLSVICLEIKRISLTFWHTLYSMSVTSLSHSIPHIYMTSESLIFCLTSYHHYSLVSKNDSF